MGSTPREIRASVPTQWDLVRLNTCTRIFVPSIISLSWIFCEILIRLTIVLASTIGSFFFFFFFFFLLVILGDRLCLLCRVGTCCQFLEKVSLFDFVNLLNSCTSTLFWTHFVLRQILIRWSCARLKCFFFPLKNFTFQHFVNQLFKLFLPSLEHFAFIHRVV